MAKLTFFYGEMGCGKTAKLIDDVESTKANGMGAIIVAKPAVDTKNGSRLLSRNGRSIDVDFLIDKDMDLFETLRKLERPGGFVFVDEAQFITATQVDQMLKAVIELNMTINCYGLRLNFYLGDENFAGATRLLQIAHKLVLIESTCDFCDRQAVFSCVFLDGKIQTSGSSILISDGTKVVDAHAICPKCYYDFIRSLSEYR